MAKTNENTQVQTLVNGVVAEVPEWLKKGNRGSEEVESNDIILPRIDVIQAISPQIKKNDPKLIAGAEAGMLFNTLTSELYPAKGITFVPVLFRKEWVAFKDRKKGGGFKGAWPFKQEAEAKAAVAAMEDADDIELLESHNHIGFVLKADGTKEQAVISCTKSKIKFSRKLNSLVTLAGADRFAKAYVVMPVEATNQSGDDYYTFDAKTLGYVSKEIYEEAEAAYEILKDRNVSTNHDQDAESEPAAKDLSRGEF
jgi:hypothetical protein